MRDSKPIRMAVKAVLFDAAQQCLVLRRSPANRGFVGCWEWPGGKLEPGEDFTDGLRRELREETGLEAEFTGLAGASEFEMPAARIILVCLRARPTGGGLRLSAEHDAFDWVPLEELAHWNILEPMKPILKTLLEKKELS
ncbi:MAG: NUDIX domain-containing protein [Verrucomicrobiota bacterium]|jgi:8-oxo-dGTP diphosphatase